jgi:hypothetical protein
MAASSEAVLVAPVVTGLGDGIVASASPSQFLLSSAWTGTAMQQFQAPIWMRQLAPSQAAKQEIPGRYRATGDFELKEPGFDQYSQTFTVRRR